jgi:hypothetical protein
MCGFGGFRGFRGLWVAMETLVPMAAMVWMSDCLLLRAWFLHYDCGDMLIFECEIQKLWIYSVINCAMPKDGSFNYHVMKF